MKKKLYVLVSNKLNPIYGAVLGGHAVAQWMIEHPDQEWNNEYLIYLSADIRYWDNLLSLGLKDFSIFSEPDLNNEKTALAILDTGSMFAHLPLLRALE